MQKIAATFVFCISALLTAVSCFAKQQSVTIEGRHIPIEILKSAQTSDWLVYLQGSGCTLSSIRENRFLQNLLSARNYNVLFISKAGVDSSGQEDLCRKDEFQRGSVRSVRIADIQKIMRDFIPQKARILLSALSEGAYIAPDIALADPRVKAYIDISGNTESYMTEELMCTAAGPKRDQLESYFNNEVRGHDSFSKFYQDWSYAYLNSYDTHQSYESMKALRIPILWMNADHDEVLWVEGARAAAKRLIEQEGKTNIQYEWIAGGGHTLHCADDAVGCDEAVLARHVSSLMTTFAAKNF